MNSILPNLDSNERGGLAIYENAIWVNVKQHLKIFWGYQMTPSFQAKNLVYNIANLRISHFGHFF